MQHNIEVPVFGCMFVTLIEVCALGLSFVDNNVVFPLSNTTAVHFGLYV